MRVEFVKVASPVYEDGALQGLLGHGFIPDAVVREVIEDFEGEEETRGRDVGVPAEDGAVDDLDLVLVRAG